MRIGSLDPNAFRFEVELNGRGASIETVKLSNHFATVADKLRFKEDPNTYWQAVADNPAKYKGRYSLLNPVSTAGQPTYRPMATRRVTLRIGDDPKPISILLAGLNWRPVEPAEDVSQGAQSASFALKIVRGPDAASATGLVRLVKTYTVSPELHSIAMTVAVENLTDQVIRVELDQAGPTGIPREDLRSDARKVAYANWQADSDEVQPRLKSVSELDDFTLGRPHSIGGSDQSNPVLWVGHTNKFFGSVMYLRPQVENRLAAAGYRAGYYVSAAMESAETRTFLTGMHIREMQVPPGKTRQAEFDLFAGPKKRSFFDGPNLDEEPSAPVVQELELYQELNYMGVVDMGGCFFAPPMLVLGMLWLLERLSILAFGNYGVAIILLVLLVRLVLHPLTRKGQVSMMKMQKMAPRMQQLKEKYADDKEALNKEMMKVYKEQGPAQILGCLPMFLQMPIWIALFTSLNATVDLRHAAFLPVWITDLAGPDALVTWANPLPLIGNTFNLLPLLLTVAMFLQTKFGPQASQTATSEQAEQTQKMMKWMMPGMMLFFFYKAPSGLTLYIMTSTFAGLLDQYLIRKHIKKKEAAEAAETITVRVPGKQGRTSRPKKPKGPNWVKRG